MRERCREQKEGQEVKLGLVSKKKKNRIKKKRNYLSFKHQISGRGKCLMTSVQVTVIGIIFLWELSNGYLEEIQITYIVDTNK